MFSRALVDDRTGPDVLLFLPLCPQRLPQEILLLYLAHMADRRRRPHDVMFDAADEAHVKTAGPPHNVGLSQEWLFLSL